MRSLFLLPCLLAAPAFAQEPTLVELYQDHYLAVEKELLAADVSHLTPAQRAARSAAIVSLRAYREAGVFGINTLDRTKRTPHFVDSNGRHCAVAHLLHTTGHDDLVEEVATTNNDLFVAELFGHSEFEGWLAQVGLEFDEAVRIQIPLAGGFGGSGGGDGGPWDVSDAAPPSPSTPPSPGPSNPAPPAPRPETPQPQAPRPVPGGAATPGPGTITPPQPALPTTPAIQELTPDAWTMWWEFNKLDFMRPNALTVTLGATTPGDSGEANRGNLVRRQQNLVRPSILRALEDPSAQVRAAAAVALGRISDGSVVPALRPLLDDASVQVREAALLALGATGSEEAAEILLAVAETGAAPRSREQVSSDAQALALVGLGVARRRGLDDAIDEEVAGLLRRRGKSERVALGLGAMVYETLKSSPRVGTTAAGFAIDRKEPAMVRARAVETLRTDPSALPTLTEILNGRREDLRRSAAMAIGDMQSPLGAATLKTAFETEKEVVTRGFVLIALGQTPDDTTTEFLIEVLEDESSMLRPWAALALGLVARERDDAAARDALRKAFTEESSATARGAYLLAFGLGGDEEARGFLEKGLASKQVPQRSYAALGLALLGGEASRDVLVAHMETERSDFVRTNVAHAIGCLGDDRDGPLLLETLAELSNPQMKGVAAVALAYHGSQDAAQGLFALTEDEDVSDSTRAAAYQALGLTLEGDPSLDLAVISRRSNFTMFPEWTLRALQVAL